MKATIEIAIEANFTSGESLKAVRCEVAKCAAEWSVYSVIVSATPGSLLE